MTQDNHMLGTFELTGIFPAPRGVPQIEVTFEVDANGILQMSAEDKGTGKAEKITITAEKGRLTVDEIEKLVHEAEAFADQDKTIKETIDARNGLESYLHNLKNSMDDHEKSFANSISSEDKRELEEIINETFDYLDSHPAASKDEYDSKVKDMEQIVNPIIRKIYSSSSGGSSGGDMEDDFGDDEL